MRVCLDCSPLLMRSAGVKTYLYELEAHLRQRVPPGDLTAFPFLNRAGALDHDGSVLSRGSTFARLALLRLLNIRGNPALDFFTRGIDVFHTSSQVHNPPHSARLTVTVQDMTCWVMPEVHVAANVANDKSFAERVVKRADGVIVPSESSRKDAVEILKLDPKRVEVIHHGVNEAYFRAAPIEKSNYDLKRPYVLFVSTIEPRKNLDRLLDAYLALAPGIRAEFELLIAGPAGWASERTFARLRSAGPDVRYLGYVPERDLSGLTAGASVFAYPSLYEGFGFPVAQAMAAGVPVLTSNNSSLPEIAGGAARLIDPYSVEEIRGGLETLLLSPGLRAEMSALGRRRAEAFHWNDCARKTWRFFENVCGM